jgi:DNA-binding CsgD family transcriptional regulator
MNSDHASRVGSSMDLGSDDSDAEKPSPQGTLATSVADLARMHGFRYYWVGHFPSADNPGLLDNRIADNWPEDLARAYDTSSVFYQSGLVGLLRHTAVPRLLVPSFFDPAGIVAARPVSRQFIRQSFGQSLGIAIHDAAGERYLIILSGKDTPTANLASIHYDATRFIDTYRRHLRYENAGARKLSRREIECLTWAAAGKNSEEIAAILDLSAHTVNFYLSSAARKLGSVNRMHSIARALRMRLI